MSPPPAPAFTRRYRKVLLHAGLLTALLLIGASIVSFSVSLASSAAPASSGGPGVITGDDIYVANPDGSGLTDIATSGSYGAVANDQAGDIYFVPPSGAAAKIMVSSGGASAVTFSSNPCPAGELGDALTYVVRGLTFTPDGSKGAWFCQSTDFSNWSSGDANGYIMYWAGGSSTPSLIYTGQGFTGDVADVKQMLLSADGSTLFYETVDQTVGATEAHGGAAYMGLYTIPTSGVTASGAATLEDGGVSGHNLGYTSSPRNSLAFINNGTTLIYDVVGAGGSNAETNSIDKVAVAGGSPSVLVAASSPDFWQVVGSADSAGNEFACSQLHYDSGTGDYSVLQNGLCDSTGTVTGALTVPADGRGNFIGYSAAGFSLAAGLPTDISAPSISGIPAEGDLLSATPGSWNSNGGGPLTYSYQWQDCNASGGSCVNVAGSGSAASYTLTAADIGHTIVVAVTASNTVGPAASSASSAPSTIVAASGTTSAPPPPAPPEPSPITAPIGPIFGTIFWTSQWSLSNTGQALPNTFAQNSSTTGTPGDDINAAGAWKLSMGAGVVVAVVDTGIDLGAPDLGGQTMAGYNFVAGNTNPQDSNGHGTFVSSEIVADGNGIHGIAPKAKIMPLQAMDAGGEGTNANIAAAFDYAGQHGVRIVSASLGGTQYSAAMAGAITSHLNTLYVLAAGNDSNDNDLFPTYPCNTPAANVICVGASDQHDRAAYFSNSGVRTVSLFAPGVNIFSDWINSASGCNDPNICPLYNESDGTSMATPLVAGTLALELAANPALSAAQLKYALLSSVDKIPALAKLSITGGRLDAAAAVLAAEHPPAETPPSVTITSAPALISESTTGHVSFVISGAVTTTKCSLATGAPAISASVPCTSSSAKLSKMEGGTYLFTVTASGPGGSSSAFESWAVTAPSAPEILLLQCPARPLVLENVYTDGRLVWFTGVAETADAGKGVNIISGGKVVAHAVVGQRGYPLEGQFSTNAPLPAASARSHTSYEATIGPQTSPSVALVQRISIMTIGTLGSDFELLGVAPPYNKKQVMLVQRRTACGKWSIAWSARWGTAQTGSHNPGAFSARGQHLSGGAVYRIVILPLLPLLPPGATASNHILAASLPVVA